MPFLRAQYSASAARLAPFPLRAPAPAAGAVRRLPAAVRARRSPVAGRRYSPSRQDLMVVPMNWAISSGVSLMPDCTQHDTTARLPLDANV